MAEAPAAGPGKGSAVSVIATMPAPSLPFSEYRLAGSCSVRAYTSSEALITRADPDRRTDDLLLLDLATGRVRSLIATPVAAGRGLVFGGSTLSDGVLAWEEVSPQDADVPEKAAWRLYASRYDSATGLVGSPALIDGAEGGERARPLFAIDGRTVVWSSNKRDSTGRWSGCVKGFDVDAGRPATLIETATPFDTFSLSEHRVLLTRETTAGGEELLSLSAADARPVVMPLNATGKPSHFPALHAGSVAWAVFQADKPWPDLFLEDAAGRRMLGRDALDPVFAGDYLFYESNEASDAPRDRSHYGSIWGIRPGTSKKFRLLLTDVSTEGWWQTAMAQGYVDDVFVVANDMSPWNERGDAYTLMRVYKLGS